MIKKIIKLAHLIDNHRIIRYLFFLICSLITIGLLGYYFGTFDQASHIPFLKKFADPLLFPNDRFFDLKNYHYSFFWFFFIPFYRMDILEITIFIIHFLVTFFTFWAIWNLAKTLFKNPVAAMLSLLAFTIPHIGFAGFPIFEFSLVNRTFVLPFLLTAINLYLKKRLIWAFIILGVMFNFHIISVNFVIAMFLLDSFVRIKEVGIKNIIYRLVIFLFFASPVLIWKFSNLSTETVLDWNWFHIINNSLLSHIFTLLTTDFLINFIILNGIATIIIFFLIQSKNNSKNNLIVNNFVWAALIIILIQAIASILLPLTIIIQSQIIRVGVFINFFAYLYFSGYIADLILSAKVRDNKIYLLIFALAFSITPIIALITLLIFNKLNNKNFTTITSILIIFIFLLTATILYKTNIWKPGINICPRKDDNYDVQLWAKNQTSKDTVFITPPYLWWFYNLEWRVISERSTVSTLSEVLEGAFLPSYIKYWRPRFEDVAPGALQQFSTDSFKNIAITKKAYYSLIEKDILMLSIKYHADYFISEKPYYYQFPIEYENNGFIVYKLNSLIKD